MRKLVIAFLIFLLIGCFNLFTKDIYNSYEEAFHTYRTEFKITHIFFIADYNYFYWRGEYFDEGYGKVGTGWVSMINDGSILTEEQVRKGKYEIDIKIIQSRSDSKDILSFPIFKDSFTSLNIPILEVTWEELKNFKFDKV